MLNEQQYLLICLMEECDEVSQRASKALRFGLAEAQPGQEPNWARLFGELNDLMTVVDELRKKNVFPTPRPCDTKRARIRKYMDYSREQGVLSAA